MLTLDLLQILFVVILKSFNEFISGLSPSSLNKSGFAEASFPPNQGIPQPVL